MQKDNIEQLQILAEKHYFLHDHPFNKWLGNINLYSAGDGPYVKTSDGRTMFDMMSALWYKAVGYGRKEIADGIHHYMTTNIESAPAYSATSSQITLAARLAKLHQHKDARVYLTSGGSESVETAIKMARFYQKHNGKPGAYKVIARRFSYHGSTGMAGSLGQSLAADNTDVEMPGAINVTNWSSYRMPYEGSAVEAAIQCANQFEEAIVNAKPESVAAMVAEPISAAYGIQVPPKEYWQRLRQIADQYNVVLIADEVITGFGRTGEWFCTMHWDVKPDITVVAKAITSGYIPLGAVIMSSKIGDVFKGDSDRHFKHILTFGGNPVACAAANTNLDIFEKENLVENSKNMGQKLLASLNNFKDKYSIVGDVRGLGLLCAIELVSDRDSKTKFPKSAKLNELVPKTLWENGLTSFRAADVIAMCPPLSISETQLNDMITKLDNSLEQLQGRLG